MVFRQSKSSRFSYVSPIMKGDGSPKAPIVGIVMTSVFLIGLTMLFIGYVSLSSCKNEGLTETKKLIYAITGLILTFLGILAASAVLILLFPLCIFGVDGLMLLRKPVNSTDLHWLNVPCHHRPRKEIGNWKSGGDSTTWVYKTNQMTVPETTLTLHPDGANSRSDFQDAVEDCGLSSREGRSSWDRPPPAYAEIISADDIQTV